jgi:hypothetical protein
MAGDGDYFGYTSVGNKELTDRIRFSRNDPDAGDVRHYPPKESNGEWPSDTINWDDPKLSGDRKDKETSLLAADSIEKIRKRMLAQDPTAMYQLGDKWFRIVRVIDDIRERVLNGAMGLKNGGNGSPGNHGGWKGKGAEAFLARGPGATIKSLDDWKTAAMANWMGTLALAQSIPNHQYKINELYDQYKKAMVSYSDDWKKKYGVEDKKVEDLHSDLQDQYVSDLRGLESWWSIQARQIQYGMAKEYHSVMDGELRDGRATVYEGPTDAVQPNPQFLARALMGNPPTPGRVAPKLGGPNVSKPNVSTNGLSMLKSTANLNKPNITPPKVEIEGQLKPDVKPDITAPTVTPPTVAPPVPPPVPVGKQPFGLRGSPGPAPSLRGGPGNLLNNLPGQGKGGPSVLGRSAVNPGQVPNSGTPSLPQSPMKGQPGAPPQSPMKGKPPSAQSKGRGQVQRPGAPEGTPGAPNPGRGAPGAPSTGRGQRAPGDPTPGASRQSGVPGQPNQFGGPPSSASSPVLRAPGSAQAPGSGQRRSGPGSPGVGQAPRTGVAGNQSPLRPGATPPVLNRPKPSKPVAAPPPSSLLPPTARNSEFAPPSMPTSRPVVGRSTRPVAGPEQDSGVLRGNRRAKARYEAQIGSRRKDAEDKRSTVDEEFDKIRQILDREEAWTVSTPGGGVLDSAPTQRVSAASEPRPTLGASPANG